MIVVAIIAILSAIAIPAYRDYLVRTQAAEGFVVASGAKAAIWDFLTDKGNFPSSNESAGLPSPSSIAGKYVSSVEIGKGGVVTVLYATSESNSSLHDASLQLSPVNTGGTVSWACNGSINPKFLPSACRKS